MIGIPELLLGLVFGTVALWAIHRLSVVTRIALPLRRKTTDDTTQFIDIKAVAVEDRQFIRYLLDE